MRRSLLGLFILGATAAGCATVETAARNLPPLTGSAGGAAAAVTLPTSGGTTFSAAQAIRKGETVEGTVREGEPRFYQLQLTRGETVTAMFYSRIALTGTYSGPRQLPVIAFLDPNGGVLKSTMTSTGETIGKGGFDRAELQYTASRAGPVLFRVDCEECGQRLHYRLAIQ